MPTVLYATVRRVWRETRRKAWTELYCLESKSSASMGLAWTPLGISKSDEPYHSGGMELRPPEISTTTSPESSVTVVRAGTRLVAGALRREEKRGGWTALSFAFGPLRLRPYGMGCQSVTGVRSHT
jgi:hypothetical protein